MDDQRHASWSPTFERRSVSGNGGAGGRGLNSLTSRHRNSMGPAAVPTDTDRALAQRRPSVAERIGTYGGVNSFNNFAKSWKRAAGFYEITPTSRSFRMAPDDVSDQHSYQRTDVENQGQNVSLLRAALQNEARRSSDTALEDDGDLLEHVPTADPAPPRLNNARGSIAHEGSFQIEPQISSPFGGSYGGAYGSLSARINESSMQDAGQYFRNQQESGASRSKSEREPLLVKKSEPQEGKFVNVVVGESTLPQTVFNSTNVLMGVGMLSLPLAFKYSGWLFGTVAFTIFTITSAYTAKLLAKCLDVDGSLITFADLAYVSFGRSGKILVSCLFILELVGGCVALVILFADSINALVSGWGVTEFKILCGLILIPLTFFPLRFLSFTSVLGIFCCIAITTAIFVAGGIKQEAPGSLHEPEKTYVFPLRWGPLPLAFGLLMAPWGGQSVFPNIYRDMRHPKKFNKGVNITYLFTYCLELALAIGGYIMFGEYVLDEVTSNIFYSDGYPHWIQIFMIVAITIIPITKLPLNQRPIISTVEIYCGLDPNSTPDVSSMSGMKSMVRGIGKILIRILVPVVLTIIAILVPSFDRVMGLLGSLACFTICISLPCAFHLKLFAKQLTVKQQILDWTILVISLILAVVGTVASFLPKDLLGAE